MLRRVPKPQGKYKLDLLGKHANQLNVTINRKDSTQGVNSWSGSPAFASVPRQVSCQQTKQPSPVQGLPESHHDVQGAADLKNYLANQKKLLNDPSEEDKNINESIMKLKQIRIFKN